MNCKRIGVLGFGLLGLVACGSGESTGGASQLVLSDDMAAAPVTTAPAAAPVVAAPVSPSDVGGITGTGTAGAPIMPIVPVAGMPAAAPVGTDMAGAAPVAPAGPTTPAGPDDGDPSTPVVEIPGIACGGPGGFIGGANHTIGGREMIVTYPCNKHEGAPMTFILNLHGTTPVDLHFYQHGYFSVHQFAQTHNFIVVTPSSVVQQWGNGDEGKDEPHLMEIIDWVYSDFGSKFDIRGMWVAGHSWGGMYTARFGCKPELADKVVGLFMQSGGGVGGFGGASCADRVAVLISTAEGDGREPSDQSALASSHGCGAAQVEMITNNKYTYWPDCSEGFAHANYYMLGKEHATSMDREVVENAADWIKASRR